MKRSSCLWILILESVTLPFLVMSGCTTSFLNSFPNQFPSSSPSGIASSGRTGTDTFTISGVNVAGPTTGASPTPSPSPGATITPPVITIYFNSNSSKTTVPVVNHCNTTTGGSAATSKPCVCLFSWSQTTATTTSSGSTTSSTIPRSVKTAVTVAQPYLLSCNGPDAYYTEIPDGTQIKVTVQAGSTNPDAGTFTVNSWTFQKTGTTLTGGIQDDQGKSLDNIHHYACYQKIKKVLNVQSKLSRQSNPVTGANVFIPLGSQFCLNYDAETCPSVVSGFSSQAYYYNLYVRTSDPGDYNQFNDSFECPTVVENLNTNNSAGSKSAPWPFDSTFALSRASTSTFTIGVETNTKLSGTNDPVSVSSSCNADSSANPPTTQNGIIKSCLGFAAPVNKDGTCPAIKDSTQSLRQTYRLRRYVAVYPRLFESDGKPNANLSQGIDTVYVLDRPVKSPAYADQSKPYSMLGPKPCPFAVYDQKGVTSTSTYTPGYVATNNPAWAGKNIDGIEFPNFDQDGISCSTTFPILSADRTTFNFSTVNKYITAANGRKHVYVRPIQPFFPHYEEDTEFQACAPQASPLQDPPLHFARDPNTGNVSWCAESYPTQNPNIAALDPAVFPSPVPSASPVVPVQSSGKIPPYTSHVVKNSASVACTASLLNLTPTPTYTYAPGSGPSSGYARHSSATIWESTSTADKTCDRTVSSSNKSWLLYPLLAPAADVERAIQMDSSYNCTVTYDGGGSKTGKYTPTDGCCDRNQVNVTTGSLGVVSPSNFAHLEPDADCRIPTY